MLRERIENVKELLKGYDREEATRELVDICNEYGQEYLVDDIIPTDYIDEYIQRELESRGWQGVACCLAKIEYLNDEYYLINGYGNLEELTIHHLGLIVSDLENNLRDEMEEEEEE